MSSNLPPLSPSQARALAIWSFAAVVLRTTGLTTVSHFLGALHDERPNTVRQRLKEFYKEHEVKRGDKRRELDVETTFAPLMGWILRLWHGHELALALDASQVGTRWVVLAVCVVYRGNALPVAWAVLPANRPGAWNPHWLRLLDHLSGVIPPEVTVLVLTDRGLWSPVLFRGIQAAGFHPFMRIQAKGLFRPTGQTDWLKLKLLLRPGRRYAAHGTLFKTRDRRLQVTLVGCFEPGYSEAWYIATDLAPSACEASWYGLRGWIEQGFKTIKSGQFQWHYSRIEEPERLERVWLVYAVGQLWLVALGSTAETGGPRQEPSLAPMVAVSLYGRTRRVVVLPAPAPGMRRMRLSRLGQIMLLAALLKGHRVPLPKELVPEAWPRASNKPQATSKHRYEYLKLAA